MTTLHLRLLIPLGGSALPVPEDIIGALPSIAWTVPDLSAIVQVRFADTESGELVACLQATLANGHTTKLDAVLWATAGFAIAAVLISWLHTAWNLCRHDSQLSTEAGLVTGDSSPAQWRVVDIIYLFQVIASSGLLTLNYPTVYPAFVQNFRWALGLFHTPSIQNAINSARDKTGGKLAEYVDFLTFFWAELTVSIDPFPLSPRSWTSPLNTESNFLFLSLFACQ